VQPDQFSLQFCTVSDYFRVTSNALSSSCTVNPHCSRCRILIHSLSHCQPVFPHSEMISYYTISLNMQVVDVYCGKPVAFVTTLRNMHFRLCKTSNYTHARTHTPHSVLPESFSSLKIAAIAQQCPSCWQSLPGAHRPANSWGLQNSVCMWCYCRVVQAASRSRTETRQWRCLH
jgi:hypothetical protein